MECFEGSRLRTIGPFEPKVTLVSFVGAPQMSGERAWHKGCGGGHTSNFHLL